MNHQRSRAIFDPLATRVSPMTDFDVIRSPLVVEDEVLSYFSETNLAEVVVDYDPLYVPFPWDMLVTSMNLASVVSQTGRSTGAS